MQTTERMLNSWCMFQVTASSLLVVDAEGRVIRGDGAPEATAFYIHSVRSSASHPLWAQDFMNRNVWGANLLGGASQEHWPNQKMN